MVQTDASVNSGSAPSSKWRFGWRHYFIICIGIWIVEEYIAYNFGWCLWPRLPKVAAAIGTILGGVSSVLLPILADIFGKKEEIREIFLRKDGESFWPAFFRCLKLLYNSYVKNNVIIAGILVIGFAVCVPAYAANIGLCQKLSAFLFPPEKLTEPFTDPPAAVEQVDPEPEATIFTAEPTPYSSPSEEADESDTPESIEDGHSRETGVQLIFLKNESFEACATQTSSIFFLNMINMPFIEIWYRKPRHVSAMLKMVGFSYRILRLFPIMWLIWKLNHRRPPAPPQPHPCGCRCTESRSAQYSRW